MQGEISKSANEAVTTARPTVISEMTFETLKQRLHHLGLQRDMCRSTVESLVQRLSSAAQSENEVSREYEVLERDLTVLMRLRAQPCCEARGAVGESGTESLLE